MMLLRYTVVDMSIPTHKIKTKGGESALNLLHAFGVKTVFRYYDYEQESIPGKTLSLDERDAIFSANLSVAVIFQHNNDNPATFVVGNRGADDARRALTLAKRLGQPFGTAIYFGVDGVDDWLENLVNEYKASNGRPMTKKRKASLAGNPKLIRFYVDFLDYHTKFNKPVAQLKPADMVPFVERYFHAVKAVFDEASGGDPSKGYTIGAYGSGLTNFALEKLKLRPQDEPFIKYTWLAQSGAWPLYEDFQSKGSWKLLQKMSTECADWLHPTEKKKDGTPKAVDFDFNINRGGDIGQWSKSAVSGSKR
jgi:hypothetical protein